MYLDIQSNIDLASLSTFAIGGKAKYYIRVSNEDNLISAINWAKTKNIPYKIFAGGSNVVFPDEGLDCLVIQLIGGDIEIRDNMILSDAGVLLMDVISKTILQGLSSLESLSGIPGTIGGAIVGNAGAYGHEIGEIVETVEVLDGSKKVILSKNECEFDYRESLFKKKPFILLRSKLKLNKGDKDKLEKYCQEIIHLREKKYKPGLKCPGSFFKNILEKDLSTRELNKINRNKIIYGKLPAGYLLEEVGAKGMRVGDIEIADFHGNLFINRGNGKASDVKQLAFILKKRVLGRFGITLEEEIRYF